MVDMQRLGRCVARHGGSSPLPGTLAKFFDGSIVGLEFQGII